MMVPSSLVCLLNIFPLITYVVILIWIVFYLIIDIVDSSKSSFSVEELFDSLFGLFNLLLFLGQVLKAWKQSCTTLLRLVSKLLHSARLFFENNVQSFFKIYANFLSVVQNWFPNLYIATIRFAIFESFLQIDCDIFKF